MKARQRGNGRPADSERILQFTIARAMLGLAIGATLAGCARDPRISIQAFVARVEQEESGRTPAASRPALPPQRPRFVPYRVGPGDVLSVSLIGLNAPTDQTALQARVNRAGEIMLPLAGVVRVGDLETEDVERAITEKYVPSIVRSLTVHAEVVTYNTTDVMVLGEVGTPGLVQLRRTERDLIHAVAAAAGFGLGSSGTVTVQRGVQASAPQVSFDLRDPYDLARSVIVEPLQAGDIVMVEAADPFTVFVGGLVTAPGPKSFPAGTAINFLQTLASAGGIREDLYPKEATLVRRMADGTDVQVKLNIERLRDGRDPNIELAAGDILWVPETFATRAMAWANANLFFRAGVSISYDPVQFERYRQTRSDSSLARRAQKRSTLLNPFSGGAGGSGLNPLTLGDPLGFLSTGGAAGAAAAVAP